MKPDPNDPRPTHDHLGMMTRPRYWPAWPVLPIKNATGRKSGEFQRMGVLVEIGLAEGDAPDIRFLDGKNFYDEIEPGELKLAPKADCRALIAAGWVVD